MKLKPAGMLVGLAGNVALAWGLYNLLGIGSCGGEYPPCPSSATPYFIAVPLGIITSVIGVFVGGGGLAFLGTFTAVGVAAVLRGFNGGAGPEGDTVFPFVFGGFFLLPALGAFLLIPLGKRKVRQAEQLVATGRRAIGVVTKVEDTGITINDNPRVKLTFSIEPQDGSPAFDGQKTITASRVAIPRAGDRYPVWFDAENPSHFMIGTDVEPTAPADIRALFEKAEQQEVQGRLAVAEAAPAPAAPAAVDWVAELGRLNELRMAGALTDEEFTQAKEKLLAGSPREPAAG